MITGSGTMTEEMSIEEGLAQIPASGVPSQDLRFCWDCWDWQRSPTHYPFVFEPPEEANYWYYSFEIHLLAPGYFAHDCGETIDLIEDTHCDCGLELDCIRVEERERKRHKLANFLFWRWIKMTIPQDAPLKGSLQKSAVGRFLLQRTTQEEPMECKSRHSSPIIALSRLLDHCPSCGRPFDPSSRIAKARNPQTGEPFEIQGGVTYRFAIMIECGKNLPDQLAIELFSTNPIKPELLELCQRHFATEFYTVCVYY